MKDDCDWKAIQALIQEIAELQKRNMLSCAKKLVSQVTEDDLLQPNDFPLLETNALFRYEEGVLAGIQTVEMALRALEKNLECGDLSPLS